MGCIRPATPGFICTLTATALLAVVSFCVPYFKSVYFLKASITEDGFNGTITFGTLGYCLELSNGTSCSSPSVGYQLDINSLVGDDTALQIPQVAVKWITYALVLHIVAFALAGGSAVFGLLAHVREMSMSCCSTCVSGFAAAIALLAFIFDLALFFTAKSRINSVGSASMGNAIWLTLAAWVLLFFSGCMYTLGRCCISNRSPRDKDWNKDNERAPTNASGGNGYNDYAEQMRTNAVKAEADRKARQQEAGLPAFSETLPLTARVDGDNVYSEPYQDHSPAPTGYGRQFNGGAGGYAGGGYVKAPVGTRAVDEYYNPTRAAAVPNSYPPQPNPQRQGSSHTYAPSNYAPSTYTNNMSSRATSPPNNNQLFAPAIAHDRASSAASGQSYGHTAGGTTCKLGTSISTSITNVLTYPKYPDHSAHEQYPSGYSQYEQPQPDPYGANQPSYNQSAYYANATPDHYPSNGYGANSVPPLPQRSGSVPALPDHPSTAGFVPYSTGSPSALHGQAAASVPQRTTSPQQYDDSPPLYDAGTGHVTGAWGKT
ncbi:SUR7/PalI family-domain-containing protein [Lentinula aciculospora]|uniref:SUR7/PalI family-domain-containing protein n=1 Tax=Lentinula aciculospora TaxID=153920 RepID=A0A9W9ALJ1_9AGAR|nr:SUR7/PalI family-domain-containing protein [Lentinula aciculospora]